MGYGNYGEEQFIFTRDERLYVNDELAELLFKDNEFHYNFFDGYLILSGLNSDKLHKLNYEFDHDILNLTWEHPHFTGIQISPKK